MRLAIALCVIVGLLSSAYAIDPHEPQQIKISLSGVPGQMVVSWVTFAPTTTSTVIYVTNGVSLNATGSSHKFIDPMNNVTARYIHDVLLTDLEFSTTYSYKVGDDNAGFSSYYAFRTMSKGSDVVNMVVFGDLGLINSQSMQMIEDEVNAGTADILLHVGDYAYDIFTPDPNSTTNGTFGDLFFNMVQPLTALVPYMGCPGNHEGKFNLSHYTNLFSGYNYLGVNSGSGSNNWFYSWEYMSGGAKVHFASINTEVYYIYVDEYAPPDMTPQLKAQYAWLDADLQKARENGADWIVVYGHRPMYCSNVDGTDCTYDSEVLRRGVNGTTDYGLEQILKKHGADIYLCGHEHSYERTLPVFNGDIDFQSNHTYINPRHPAHIITGSAGCQEGYDYYDDVFYGPWSVVRSSSYGYGHLVVHNATHLYWDQSIDEGRAGWDTLWIIKDSDRL